MVPARQSQAVRRSVGSAGPGRVTGCLMGPKRARGNEELRSDQCEQKIPAALESVHTNRRAVIRREAGCGIETVIMKNC